jgi:UDP-N-acetylmuramoylalanine--D-glutamate ligase
VSSGDERAPHVVVLGLGRQGVATARYFAARGVPVIVSDSKPAEALTTERQLLQGLDVRYELGGHPLEMLDGASMLHLSGGVPGDLPIVAAARARGLRITNDSQLFLEICPARVVGVTGSAGKTTTTSLVGDMARAAAERGEIRRAWVGGNIGNPLLNEAAEMQAGDVAVMELSSFQLEVMTRSPQVAAVLNLTPNHLDRHGTMAAYGAAKARILDFQGSQDEAVLGWDSPETRAMASRVRGRLSFFSIDGPRQPEWKASAHIDQEWICLSRGAEIAKVVPIRDVRLRGRHNLANAVAACAIAQAAGLSQDAMAQAVRSFRGVEHRLEWVARVSGVDWYNDSIATAPERAIAAMRSFEEPIILLAGGRDKKLPWEEWAQVVRSRVEHLILFGEAAPLIRRALGEEVGSSRPKTVSAFAELGPAVAYASRLAAPGDVVLLAPGGTSFDQYRDFEERGEHFRSLVRALQGKGRR